jgi:hypothetical protein
MPSGFVFARLDKFIRFADRRMTITAKIYLILAIKLHYKINRFLRLKVFTFLLFFATI